MAAVKCAKYAAFRSAHGAALGGRVVVEAGKMEKAVDEVEGEFVVGGSAELAGDSTGALGADDDFTEAIAEIETDDIRRAGVVEELPVDRGDGVIVNDSDAEFPQRVVGIPPLGVGGHDGRSGAQEPKQPCSGDRQVALTVAQTDSERVRTLGFHPWGRRCGCEACSAAFA